MNKIPTVRVVTATEAQTKFGEMIRYAYGASEHVIVEKSGIPVVAIIPMVDYQQLVPADTPEIGARVNQAGAREGAVRDLRAFLRRVHAQAPDIPEDEVDRDIELAKRQVRRAAAKQAKPSGRGTRKATGRRAGRLKA